MRIFICILVLIFSNNIGNAQNLMQSDFSIGKTIKFQSLILNEERTINVYLPVSYQKEKTKSYPVIYLLDGSK